MRGILMLQALALLGASPAPPQPGNLALFTTAGYVIAIAPRHGQVSIVRHGGSLEAYKGMPLADGDQVLISGNARVKLASNAAERSGEFSEADSPVKFPELRPPPGRIQSVLKALLDAGKPRSGLMDRPAAVPAQAPSKGSSECPPNTSTAQLLAPTPALRSQEQEFDSLQSADLAWVGGIAPYRVSYSGLNNPISMDVKIVCDKYIDYPLPQESNTFPEVMLHVRDSMGAELIWSIHRVRTAVAGPVLKGETADLDALTRALAQLSEPDGRHALKALSELQTLSSRNFIAWRLIQGAHGGEDL